MGTTKKLNYTESQLELANLFKALGHPARITIVEKLLENENLNCNDLKNFTPLAQSTISQHINVLQQVGLIGYEVVINNAVQRVGATILSKISWFLIEISRQLENASSCSKYTHFKPQYTIKPQPT